jgi:hypothetical protein
MQPYLVWIEAEHWAPGQWVPQDTNSDVLVTLADGSQWAATFFSYQNIQTLRDGNRASGECLGGRYLWASDMILIEEVTRERVEEVVADLIASGDFQRVFERART